MADFKTHRVRVGPRGHAHFQVYIAMSNCGIRKTGHVAISNCVTVKELDEEIEKLARSLRKARNIAAQILENQKSPRSN
jgi:hypothetical protein